MGINGMGICGGSGLVVVVLVGKGGGVVLVSWVEFVMHSWVGVCATN